MRVNFQTILLAALLSVVALLAFALWLSTNKHNRLSEMYQEVEAAMRASQSSLALCIETTQFEQVIQQEVAEENERLLDVLVDYMANKPTPAAKETGSNASVKVVYRDTIDPALSSLLQKTYNRIYGQDSTDP